MELGIRGKNVVVTGGSMGIGYAAAELFLQEGAYVTIAARNEQRLKKAVYELSQKYGEEHIRGVPADCSKEADVKKLAAAAAREARIDIWGNNVGTNKLR